MVMASISILGIDHMRNWQINVIILNHLPGPVSMIKNSFRYNSGFVNKCFGHTTTFMLTCHEKTWLTIICLDLGKNKLKIPSILNGNGKNGERNALLVKHVAASHAPITGNSHLRQLILICKLCVIYVREDNDPNVEFMIARIIWALMLDKAVTLNHSITGFAAQAACQFFSLLYD